MIDQKPDITQLPDGGLLFLFGIMLLALVCIVVITVCTPTESKQDLISADEMAMLRQMGINPPNTCSDFHNESQYGYYVMFRFHNVPPGTMLNASWTCGSQTAVIDNENATTLIMHTAVKYTLVFTDPQGTIIKELKLYPNDNYYEVWL